jgi:hypothetical protein
MGGTDLCIWLFVFPYTFVPASVITDAIFVINPLTNSISYYCG